MDVEPLEETPGELAETGNQTLDLPATPQVEEQSANKEAVGEFRAPTMGDELTAEKQDMDDSLVEGEAAAEEPAMEAPPAREEPAAEHPALGCECPQDTQEDERVEVHVLKDDPDVW